MRKPDIAAEWTAFQYRSTAGERCPSNSVTDSVAACGEKAPAFKKLTSDAGEIRHCLVKIIDNGIIQATHHTKWAKFFWIA